MRASREQALESRRRIVEHASQLFRERGFDGVGIADLMKASGMTHGGFYKHFSSKEDLASEALSAAYEQFQADSKGKKVEALLTRYISKEHRDELSSGCPTSAVGGDAMRQPDTIQQAFAKGVESWLNLLGDALGADYGLGASERRARSIDLAARAIGAIVLSRATAADSNLSDEVLRTCLSEGLAEVGKLSAKVSGSLA